MFNRPKKLSCRIITLVLIPIFFASNLTFAQAIQDTRSTLAPYYITKVIEENREFLDGLKYNVTPSKKKPSENLVSRLTEKTAKDFGQDWVQQYAKVLVQKVATRLIALQKEDGRISLTSEYAKRALVDRVKTWDMPRYRKNSVINAIESHFDRYYNEAAPSGQTGTAKARSRRSASGSDTTDLRPKTEVVRFKSISEAVEARLEAMGSGDDRFTQDESAAFGAFFTDPSKPLILIPQFAPYDWGGISEDEQRRRGVASPTKRPFLQEFFRPFFESRRIPFPEYPFYAEAWLGSHRGAKPREQNMASRAVYGGHQIELGKLIRLFLDGILGRGPYNRYVKQNMEKPREHVYVPKKGYTELPILLKLSEAWQQLSNQVHPNLRWAVELNEHQGYPDKNEKVEGWFGIDEAGVWIFTGFRDETSLRNRRFAQDFSKATGLELYTIFDEDFYTTALIKRLDAAKRKYGSAFEFEKFLKGVDVNPGDFERAVGLDTTLAKNKAEAAKFLLGSRDNEDKLRRMLDAKWKWFAYKVVNGQDVPKTDDELEATVYGYKSAKKERKRAQAIESFVEEDKWQRYKKTKDDDIEREDPGFKARLEAALRTCVFNEDKFKHEMFYQKIRDEAVNVYHNLIHLKGGQMALIQPMTIHAIVYGRYGEIQTASDNTLRAANTRKELDIENLLKVTNFKSGEPAIYDPTTISRGDVKESVFEIEKETDRFEIGMLNFPRPHATFDPWAAHQGKPREGFDLLLCMNGEFEVKLKDDSVFEGDGPTKGRFGKGTALLMHPMMGNYKIRSLTGDVQFIRASVPYHKMPERWVGKHATKRFGVVSDYLDYLEFVKDERTGRFVEDEETGKFKKKDQRIVVICDSEVHDFLNAFVDDPDFEWWRRLRALSHGGIVTLERAQNRGSIEEIRDKRVGIYNPDRIVVIGSSATIDLGQLIGAYYLNKPVTFIPTALTTNTYYSYKSHVNTAEGVRAVVTSMPTDVVVDTDLLHYFIEEQDKRYDFPSALRIDSRRANLSSLGDIICLATALWDWKRASLCDPPKQEMAGYEDIYRRHKEILRLLWTDAELIRELRPEGLELLDRYLYETAANASFFGNSHPQSGAEHILSDAITAIVKARLGSKDFFEDQKWGEVRPRYLHGEKVAVATLIIAYLQELLDGGVPTKEGSRHLRLISLVTRLGLRLNLKELGLTKDILMEAVIKAEPRDDKYTFFDIFCKMSDQEKAGRAQEAIGATFDDDGNLITNEPRPPAPGRPSDSPAPDSFVSDDEYGAAEPSPGSYDDEDAREIKGVLEDIKTLLGNAEVSLRNPTFCAELKGQDDKMAVTITSVAVSREKGEMTIKVAFTVNDLSANPYPGSIMVQLLSSTGEVEMTSKFDGDGIAGFNNVPFNETTVYRFRAISAEDLATRRPGELPEANAADMASDLTALLARRGTAELTAQKFAPKSDKHRIEVEVQPSENKDGSMNILITFTIDNALFYNPCYDRAVLKAVAISADGRRFEATFDRQAAAQFTNLPPGSYTYEVLAEERTAPPEDSIGETRASASGVNVVTEPYTAAVDSIGKAMHELAASREVSAALARDESRIDYSKFDIVMTQGLIDAMIGKGGMAEGELQKRYQGLRKDLENLFYAGQREVEKVNTLDELIARIRDRQEGHKVIILDNGSLINENTLAAIEGRARGKAGEDYCAIKADQETLKQLNLQNIPFVNLNAMALMGVGILQGRDGDALFEKAYKAFTGLDNAKEVLRDARQAGRWIISVLPRIVRFDTDILPDQKRLKELFDIAA